MPELRLHVLSLRYSSWSIRPYLALKFAGADLSVRTVEIPDMTAQSTDHGPSLVSLNSEKLASPGVYVYKAWVTYMDGRKELLQGDITFFH